MVLVNYGIDTVAIHGIDFFEYLLKTYPQEMARIESLDVQPATIDPSFERGRLKLTAMTGLKQATVRTLEGKGFDLTDAAEKARMFAHTLHHMWEGLDLGNKSWNGRPPILATIFSPEEGTLEFWMNAISIRVGAFEKVFTLKEPRKDTWDTFEVDIPEEWRLVWSVPRPFPRTRKLIWPGRRRFPRTNEDGTEVLKGAINMKLTDWFAVEVE